MRDETGQGSNFSKHAYFVELCYDGVQNLTFEWSKDDRLVLDRIDDKTLTGLNDAGSDVVDRGDGNNKTIFARTSTLDLVVELLLYSFDELWTKVARVEQDFVLERDLEVIGTKLQIY
jgi:hypothetical protein